MEFERNPTLDALCARKSVRVFTEEPVPQAVKNALFQAAMQAPTAGNQMLYTILDITDAALKARLADLCDHQPFIADAPVVLVFVADCQRWYDGFAAAGCAPRPPREGDLLLAAADAAIAAQNTVVAAESFGLGSCYIGDILENCEDVRSALALPPYAVPAAMLVLGRPTQQQRERRKPARFDARYIVRENRSTRPCTARARPPRAARTWTMPRGCRHSARANTTAFFHGRCPARPRYTCAPFRRSARPARRKETRAASGGRRTAMRERTDVCGRFAPSPSGRMHLGNVFCAVVAWLSARSRGGRFLLRIEDLDVRRCKPEHARLLEEDLAWLGLEWDEGGRRGGPDGPYFQSECSELYAQALQMLKEHARVYPCFCSRADLHAASAPHLSDGAVLYGGRCARLSPAEADALRRRRAPALRIAVPEESVSFTDGHLGHFSQNLARECGDFILRRSDGIYAYQLAVAVDDARMGVTQVVRGQDLLSSTPRQIFLQRLLGLPTPEYYHLPLLVNAEGVRLSKREKSLDMGALRARFTPAELTGWLAFLAGQQPAPEPVPLRSLAACFSWEKVPRRDITVPARLLNEARAE